MLSQSRVRRPVPVTLLDNTFIPPHSKVLNKGRVTRSADSQLGMISPKSNQDDNVSGIHIAYVVAKADGRTVPIRIANTSDVEMELAAPQQIAEFSILAETPATTIDRDQEVTCSSVGDRTKLSAKLEAAIDPSLSPVEKDTLRKVLLEFSDVFSESLGVTNIVNHKIDTGDSPPIKQRARRLPFIHREEADRQIKNMITQGVIEPSTSPWSSPIVLVRTKDGQLHFCIDYRKLNLVTQCEAHPIPRTDDILDSLSGAKLFTTLDLRSGYWQVPMDPKDTPKTAFSTQAGLFQFVRMPFGLSSGPATFQRMIELVLSGLNLDICLCYLVKSRHLFMLPRRRDYTFSRCKSTLRTVTHSLIPI